MHEIQFFFAGLLLGGGVVAIIAIRRYDDLYQRSMTAVDRLLTQLKAANPSEEAWSEALADAYWLSKEEPVCPHCVDGVEHTLEHEGKP